MDLHCDELTREVDDIIRARYPIRTHRAMMNDYRAALASDKAPAGRDAGVLAFVNLLIKAMKPHGLDFETMDKLIQAYSRVEAGGGW